MVVVQLVDRAQQRGVVARPARRVGPGRDARPPRRRSALRGRRPTPSARPTRTPTGTAARCGERRARRRGAAARRRAPPPWPRRGTATGTSGGGRPPRAGAAALPPGVGATSPNSARVASLHSSGGWPGTRFGRVNPPPPPRARPRSSGPASNRASELVDRADGLGTVLTPSSPSASSHAWSAALTRSLTCEPGVGQLDDDAAAVGGIGRPGEPARRLEPVEGEGHAAGGAAEHLAHRVGALRCPGERRTTPSTR